MRRRSPPAYSRDPIGLRTWLDPTLQHDLNAIGAASWGCTTQQHNSSTIRTMDLIQSPAFATHINGLLQKWHTPGLAVAVVQNSTVAARGFELATLDPPRNVTPDTLFDIASSSKSLTAASVGLLVIDELNYPQLQWDTPMSHLLPEDFVMSGEGYTEQVTVEDILSHRSGFPRHDYSYLNQRATHPDTPQSVTENLRNLQNAAPLRTKFIYSNIMYIVASWLVEKMTGLSFSDFLYHNFFQ